MKLTERVRKWHAIRSYIRVLGPRLVSTYGLADSYSIGRILTAMGASKVSDRYVTHAVAMFGDADTFCEWKSKASETEQIIRLPADERSPHRTQAEVRVTTSDDGSLEGIHRAMWADLRRDAARYNSGRTTFILVKDDRRWDNGDDDEAMRRWGGQTGGHM